MRVAEPPAEGVEDYALRDHYAEFQQAEGVRVIEDFAFEDLEQVELGPWPRKGGSGAIINIPYPHLPNDAHLVEIPPQGHSEPEHHLYEENVYVVSGRGATTIWYEGGEKQRFEWRRGALFAIPLNAWYQHFNVSGTEALRYIAVTNAPPMMRLLGDNEAIFNSPSVFRSRFDGERDYFSADGKLYKHRIWETNFVPNAPDMRLYSWSERGGGGINVMLEMAKNNLKCHISEFPVGTYKKAHRHGPGAHLLVLSGEGFSLLWNQPDMSDMRKADWRRGGMVIVPSDACFHQHFNTGATRARYLAMRGGSMGLEAPRHSGRQGADVSIKEGGWQVEYEDEDSRVHELFEAELSRHSVPCRMKAFIPGCTGVIGPTDQRNT